MKKKLQCFLLLILFVTCKQEAGNEKFVVLKDENGNVESEINYINDT